MRKNPFADIYKACNSGATNREKCKARNDMRGPLLLDVELTNACNLQCYMCPTGTNSLTRPKGFMSEKVMNRIVEDVKEADMGGVRFILWGEPTLHPNFLEFSEKIKDAGKLVHFNTNGILLTEEMLKAVVEMEVDSVKFSFQGVDKRSYEEMRLGSDWDKLLGNIRQLNAIRGEKEKPYIQISTTVTDEEEERIEKFCDEMKPLCEYINVGQTILSHLDIEKMRISDERKTDFRRLKSRQSLVEKHLNVCPEIYTKLSVLWNGDVTMCCNDFDGSDMVLGNILNDSIRSFWKSEKAEEFCKLLEEDRYDRIGICSMCYEYISLES